MDMSLQRFFDMIFYVNQNLKEATKLEPANRYHTYPEFWRDGNGEKGNSTQFSYHGLHPNSPNRRKLYAKSLQALIHHSVRMLTWDMSVINIQHFTNFSTFTKLGTWQKASPQMLLVYTFPYDILKHYTFAYLIIIYSHIY